MGSFTRWLSELFGAARAEEIEEKGYSISSEEEIPLALEKSAIQSAVGLIAAAVGQCRFRTFVDGEEHQGEEYWLWNYSPNRNSSSTQFIQELVETLIYDNEALVVEVHGELFIADTFSYQEEGAKEYLFSGITLGRDAVADRRSSEVLFFRMSNTEIRPLLSGLCHQYERLIGMAVSSYEKAGADKGILNVENAARGELKMGEYKNDLLENKFKKFFSAQNAVLPLYKGYTYTPHKRELRNTSEINDVKSLSDEVYNRVGQVFRIPPALLKGETAQSGDSMDKFIRLCVRPICNMLEEEITRKRYGMKAMGKGSFLTIDTAMLEITGLFASAEKLDRIIGCGILSIDEVREKTGERALGTPEAQMHFITKNYGKVDTGKEEGSTDE